MSPKEIKRKHFEQKNVEYTILSAINIGVAGTSAPSRDAHKNYPIYSALHREHGGVKRKYFEQGKVEYPVLNGSNWECTR